MRVRSLYPNYIKDLTERTELGCEWDGFRPTTTLQHNTTLSWCLTQQQSKCQRWAMNSGKSLNLNEILLKLAGTSYTKDLFLHSSIVSRQLNNIHDLIPAGNFHIFPVHTPSYQRRSEVWPDEVQFLVLVWLLRKVQPCWAESGFSCHL